MREELSQCYFVYHSPIWTGLISNRGLHGEATDNVTCLDVVTATTYESTGRPDVIRYFVIR